MKYLPIIISYFAMTLMLTACASDDNINMVQPEKENGQEHEQTQEQVQIGFDTYISRSKTRGTPITGISDLTGEDKGFGVFAMYTNSGKQYRGGSINKDSIGSFTPGFMDNFHVKAATSTNETENIENWTYSPLRYWPPTANEYVSFLAYAPWKTDTQLYGMQTTTSGNTTTTSFKDDNTLDRTYIQYSVGSGSVSGGSASATGIYASATDTYDLMWNSNDATNQQLIVGTDGKYSKGNNFTDTYRQKMSFRHATARLAFGITSSVLGDSHNFKSDGTAEASITVNKFMLIGDGNTSTTTNSSSSGDAPEVIGDATVVGGDDIDWAAKGRTTRALPSGVSASSPNGAFYQSGYLNLNNSKADNGTYKSIWFLPADKKLVYFSFNGKGQPQTVSGEIDKTKTPNKWIQNTDDPPSSEITATRQGKGTTEDPYTYSVNAVGNSTSDYMFIIPTQSSSSDSHAAYALNGSMLYDANTQKSSLNSGNGQAVSSEAQLYCYVNYTVNYSSMSDGEAGKNITYEVYAKLNNTFEGGHAYVILVDIGKATNGVTSFTSISFNVKGMDGWSTE